VPQLKWGRVGAVFGGKVALESPRGMAITVPACRNGDESPEA
jgi:hypothetical protein